MDVIDVMMRVSVSISIVCVVLGLVMTMFDRPGDVLCKAWVIILLSAIGSWTATLICGVWVN